jgi:hypothetical protein
VTAYVQTILRAAEHLAAGRGLNYRQRLQLERAVFRLTSAHTMRALGWCLQSMAVGARDQLFAYCEVSGVEADDPRLVIVNRGFAVMRLIASIANADPYVLNENISRIIHRYSTGVATLPSALHEFVAAQSQSTSEYEAVVDNQGGQSEPGQKAN